MCSLRPVRIAVLLAVTALGCHSSTSSHPATAARPNVVVVLIDTLRPDHLTAYGYAHETAPFLSSLAQTSTVFLNAMSSSSWTAPSTASLFTGLYPNRHGVIRGFFADRKRQKADRSAAIEINRIAADAPTMPELFQDRGYRTFGVAANLNIGPEIGFSRGFDQFRRLGDVDSARKIGADDAPAEAVLAQVREWRDQIRGSQPFFLYLHLNDPHGPYTPHERWLRPPRPGEPAALPAYDSEISYADWVVGQIYEELSLGDAVVVVVSDHGNAFGEHGKTGHGPGAGLYGAVNRVVTMMRVPGLGLKPQRIDVPVSLVDVLPTLLELAPGATPTTVAGRSLVPLLRGGEDPSVLASFNQRALFAHLINYGAEGDVWSVMQRPWKLIRDPDGTLLFDFIGDPQELQNLAPQQTSTVAQLEVELKKYLAGTRAGQAVELGLSPAELERLRSLGYAE